VADRNGDRPLEKAAGPGAIERILFARVEAWVLLLTLLLGCLLMIGFGAAVLDAEREKGRFGSWSQVALAMAEIPATAKHMVVPDIQLRVGGSDRDADKRGGWSFPSGPMTGADGYILLSRYDGTQRRHKLELVQLPTMRLVHSWTLHPDKLLRDVVDLSRYEYRNIWDDEHFRQIHPWVEENGDLIVKEHDSPIFRVNPCGDLRWTLQDAAYHHAMEPDADGNLWVPAVAHRHLIERTREGFREETFNKVSPSGKLLYTQSVAQMLVRHGYASWLFTIDMYRDDAVHLNDVQPVLSDGPYWKKGDVFLSLRNLSTVMLYRPSADEILWVRRGPWISQHDVDILDDHRIGVYDNANEDRGLGPYFPLGASQIRVYDFATDKVGMPLQKAMVSNKVRTWMEGLFTSLPGGLTMIEDSIEGRIIIFRPDGRVAAEFFNRASDGFRYHLGWSRYVEKAKGDAILQNLSKVRCIS
jgi:hypothetical protein